MREGAMYMRFDLGLKEQLAAEAKRREISMTDLVHEAVAAYLKQDRQEQVQLPLAS